ncbi:MAG: hypothetical protein ACW99F_03685 [Candidatus Hodarchaeales archaeon]
MVIFPSPEYVNFFDNRILISWEISQPKNFPVLKKIQFKIFGEPELEFEPNQDPVIELPSIEDNKIILNWIIKKPQETTNIQLSITTTEIQETHRLTIKPETKQNSQKKY